ncbi:NAD(+)/NADH kinase [Alistipes sp. An31A]|uniref:NAD(+)/NADH kinase n=1 Tax=Alistipes sp. An31A TaxID=1965631 RepID=UPI000B3A4E63|nr:NAD(+)/NADH kinase [Alistipes sp. An31A]OUO23342.1 NADH kinase [Alistipes sp. An31A]HIV32285.1 NAD(+)/NADH kinase [Candidatus Alistipes excrementigallinarum]
MKIILFSRPQVAHDAGELRQLFDGLDAFGFECVVNEEFAPVAERLTGRLFPPSARYGSRVGEVDARAAVMLCYGGDGTLLEGAHRLGGAPVPVLGVNAGHLGFLTSVPTGGMAPLLEEIRDGGLRTEPRTLLEVRGSFAQQPESTFCLNEFTVQRHGAGLISVETYVDEQMVATYHGDGVIVSTPTGSTAYSLSAGGPVVAPTCSCMVITPIAPHNLTMRPVVIPDTSRVRLHIRARHSDPFITLDNRTCAVAPEAVFTVERAEQKIFLAVPHNISFYDTLRNKMMWGIDIRS